MVLGGHTVLKDASFNLDPGERLAIVGVNGAGKTTLARAALGLSPLASGSGTLFGINLAEDADRLRSVRTRAGVAMQGGSLFGDMTVEENLRMAQGWLPPSARARTGARMNRLLLDFRIEDVYGRITAALSNGERRRVEIARALARDPELLILDEPLDALDTAAAEALEESLHRALRRRPRALLLLTRDAALASRFAQRALRLERGTLQAEQLSDRPRSAAVS